MGSKKKPLGVIAGAADRPLVIGDVEIPCYVLEDETRVLSQRGLQSGVGMSTSGGAGGAHRMARFLASFEKKGFISKNITARISSPVVFRLPQGGGQAYGYPAELLADICEAVIDARDAGALLQSQKHIAERCNILWRGFARVGINALVDEATGYEEIREKRALATILEKFIAEELQPYTATFPYEFYKQIFRLKGWPGPDGAKRPSVIGHYTNDIVYARLAPGVLDELRRLNPSRPDGKGRKWAHHQWFKPEPGYIKLNQHIAAVIALMRASANWDQFRKNLKRAFPDKNEQLDFLDED